MIKEFKEFAMKGNVMDMAVGIIIGGAFGKIVASLVGDIIMPVVGSLTGGGSLGDHYVWLSTEADPGTLELARKSGEAYVAWGPFAQTTMDFLIVAFAIFVMVKAMNKARSLTEGPKDEAPAAPTTKECEFCQSTISIKATRCPNCTSQLSPN
ncbi:MAG: large conductance mechanosensitive channel protein MscL [Planctomycetaceae bacterium]|nr:large conductance mechanosensitive channel protein MscL [Planctomycetaceae bacterium]MCB9926261.1 large conductance mechanosensitive channel protein MscL [Planctomycetaceae bacterium]